MPPLAKYIEAGETPPPPILSTAWNLRQQEIVYAWVWAQNHIDELPGGVDASILTISQAYLNHLIGHPTLAPIGTEDIVQAAGITFILISRTTCGAAPLQIEGEISIPSGKTWSYYFRSRGDGWALTIYPGAWEDNPDLPIFPDLLQAYDHAEIAPEADPPRLPVPVTGGKGTIPTMHRMVETSWSAHWGHGTFAASGMPEETGQAIIRRCVMTWLLTGRGETVPFPC